jgi:hypothetical protein
MSTTPPLTDWEMYTATGTWALAIVTLLAVAISFRFAQQQIKESKKSTGLQLFVQLTRDYQSPEMRELRKQFAAIILANRQPKAHHSPVSPLSDQTVLDFFENISHLTKDNVLEKKIVWNYFCDSILNYWHSISPYVTNMRNEINDQSLFEDFEWLCNEFIMLNKGIRPDDNRLKNFLESEAYLFSCHPGPVPGSLA